MSHRIIDIILTVGFLIVIFCFSIILVGYVNYHESRRVSEEKQEKQDKVNVKQEIQELKTEIKEIKEEKQEETKYDYLRKYFPKEELDVILKEAIENHCNGDLLYILLAVRKAENGPKGLEFGIMHPRAKYTNLETQAGWAAATVAKNYKRWNDSKSPSSFIKFLGNKYCPLGADNDLNNVNRFWISNVRFWYDKFKNHKGKK